MLITISYFQCNLCALKCLVSQKAECAKEKYNLPEKANIYSLRILLTYILLKMGIINNLIKIIT